MTEQTSALHLVRQVSTLAEPKRTDLLEALRLLDLHGGEDDVPVDRNLTLKLWREAEELRTLSTLDQAYVIWRLHQKVTSNVWNEEGDEEEAQVERWLTWGAEWCARYQEDPSAAWTKFCLEVLGMDPNTAYQRRRTWDLYHETLGYERKMLERAGISKLNRARSQMSRDWEAGGTDETLEEMLFGQTYEEADEAPPPPDGDEEPLTDEDYVIPPASDDQIQAYVASRRADRPGGERLIINFQIDGDGEEEAGPQRLVTAWIRRPGNPVPEPVEFAVVSLIPSERLTDDERRAAWAQFRRAMG